MLGTGEGVMGASLEVPVGDADIRGRLRLPLLEWACGRTETISKEHRSLAGLRTEVETRQRDADGAVRQRGRECGRMEQCTFVDGVDDDCVCVDRLLLDVSDEPADLAW